MMKLILLLLLLSLQVNAGEISLSFDDAPTADGQMYAGTDRTNILINKLQKAKVKAVFYVNSIRIDRDSGDSRLRQYSNAGHLIGNHTHSHSKISSVGLKSYIEDIQKAHELIKDYKNFKSWFRFPYLKRGEKEITRDSIRKFLADSGYFNAYTTIDNFDWSMNSIFENAIRSGVTPSKVKVCEAYSELLWGSIKYYDDMALKYLKRSPKHVLLLHENDLAAFCVDDLISYIRSKKWKIISPEDSYTDKIANITPNTLYLGQGRVSGIIHEMTGIKARSKWENVEVLKSEFKKRKVFD